MYGDYSLGLYDCRRPVAGINGAACWDSATIASPCDPGSFYRMQWNHVVVVFNNTGSGAVHPTAVYLNGVANTDWHGTGPMSLDTGNVYLGDNFKGLMDEVRIYNTAFTASEVNALYAYGIMGCCNTTTSVPEINNNSRVHVYPNPSTGLFQVELPLQFTDGQLRVFNSLGQQVFQTPAGIDRLDLQQLPAGIYMLDCSNASGDTHIRQTLTKY
jgi:hypothetical protein